MTDVRLTATNPEDSSVVPVACNSRGELLITKPVIEEIDNDVTVNGKFKVFSESDGGEGSVSSTWSFTKNGLSLYIGDDSELTHRLSTNGQVSHFRLEENLGSVTLCSSVRSIQVSDSDGTSVWSVTWDGTSQFRSVQIPLDPDNQDHYAAAEASQGEEAVSTYTGPVLDVAEELVFLRAQVQAVMERLKMTPEGGWPVWDGSD